MRDILDLCVQMDELARDTYHSIGISCVDEKLVTLMERLAADEAEHVGWWRDLIDAWERGLLPDIVNEPEALGRRMAVVLSRMKETAPDDRLALSEEDVLTVAAKLEFLLLDPVFGELLDLTEPGLASARHEAYASHLDRLIVAIEEYYPAESLAAFLARLLRRTWQDHRRLATYAMSDPLTGLYNRRAFDAHLRQWAAWAARYGRPLAVLLVDVDDLQQLNESRGHTIGDTTLTAIAGAIGSAVRNSDFVARYGGDEFAILAPEADVETLRGLADRVISTVRDTEVPTGGGAVRVTVSVGSVVTDDAGGSATRPIESLLAAADKGLYLAKRSGKDRAAEPVVLSSASSAA